MKATELRIGNWVLEFGIPLQVSLNNADLWHSDNFTGIPLTPEILVKCGFRHAESLGLEYVTMPNIVIRLSDMMYGCIDYEGRFDETIKIYSVHQLQNLYFALTGTELNYQL